MNGEVEEARGKVPRDQLHNFTPGRAAEFELRYESDMTIMRALGHNTIRFSVDWATIEPEEGLFNEAILERYRAMCNFARSIGLEPVVTLYHWTHRNGFEWYQPNAPQLYARFVRKTIPYLGDIKLLFTFNEPPVYLSFSYRWGMWPPQIHENNDPLAYVSARQHMIEAHNLGFEIIRELLPNCKIAVAQSASWNTADDPEVKAREDMWQYDFLDAVDGRFDVIGYQPYMHNHFPAGREPLHGWKGEDACAGNHPVVSDMNWGMCPRIHYGIGKELYQRYGKPIAITESGHAVREIVDYRRCWYIWETFGEMQKLVSEGIPLIGYYHWSTLDNFEWKYGFWPQFGLIHVNRATQERTMRCSAELYRRLIEARGQHKDIARDFAGMIRHPHAHAA
jgi:beta-glucosidase